MVACSRSSATIPSCTCGGSRTRSTEREPSTREPARLRQRVERMGRGLSPRTRRALRTGVSRSDVERRRRSRTARARIDGTLALRRSPSSISTSTRNSWSCSTPIPSSSRRSDAGSTRPSATRTRSSSAVETTNAAPVAAGGASAPRHERCPRVGPGPSLIRRARRRDSRHDAPAASAARLLPPHPQDRGRDRHHVPRRGLPLRADLSGDRLGRPARAAGRDPARLPALPWSLRCDAARAAPETSAGRDDAARSGRARGCRSGSTCSGIRTIPITPKRTSRART